MLLAVIRQSLINEVIIFNCKEYIFQFTCGLSSIELAGDNGVVGNIQVSHFPGQWIKSQALTSSRKLVVHFHWWLRIACTESPPVRMEYLRWFGTEAKYNQ